MVEMLDFEQIQNDVSKPEIDAHTEPAQPHHGEAHEAQLLTDHDKEVDEFYTHGYHGHEGHPAEDPLYEHAIVEEVHHEPAHYEPHYDAGFDSFFEPVYEISSDDEDDMIYFILLYLHPSYLLSSYMVIS